MLKCLKMVLLARAVVNAQPTLVDARGERILPAYRGNRYLNLLPGESCEPPL